MLTIVLLWHMRKLNDLKLPNFLWWCFHLALKTLVWLFSSFKVNAYWHLVFKETNNREVGQCKWPFTMNLILFCDKLLA
jgi:hypothetical protein